MVCTKWVLISSSVFSKLIRASGGWKGLKKKMSQKKEKGTSRKKNTFLLELIFLPLPNNDPSSIQKNSKELAKDKQTTHTVGLAFGGVTTVFLYLSWAFLSLCYVHEGSKFGIEH